MIILLILAVTGFSAYWAWITATPYDNMMLPSKKLAREANFDIKINLIANRDKI